MEKYMLIFRNSTTSENEFQNLSPEAMQAELDKWGQWIGGIAAQGKLVSTDALEHTGKIVKGSKHVITDGPYIESKELVSGYLTLSADSIEEAIELSKGCPIYEIEGSVEVRPLMNFNE
ncbi:MAG: hypothetical protein HUU01_13675 [Saprospiraceae bacterium]|nr:hypothetical protein [Saprospiraceae bacterium]